MKQPALGHDSEPNLEAPDPTVCKHVGSEKSNVEEDESAALVPGKGHAHSRLFVGFGLDEYMGVLQRHFGWKLLVLLSVVQHVLKGFVLSFQGKALPYLFRSYGVPAPQVQILNGVTTLPWAVKPILGLVSDVVPIFGYHKGPYMVLASVTGVLAFVYVGASSTSLSISAVVMALVLINLQASTCDLLSEAKYAEKIQVAPSHGPALLSYVWFGMQVGMFAAVLISGPVLASFSPESVYMACAPAAATVLIPLALGYLEEKQATAEEIKAARQRHFEQREASVLCLLMLFCSIAILVVGLLQRDPLVNAVMAIGAGLVMLTACTLVLSPVIAKFNAFSLVYTAMGVSTGGASFYFYTDTPAMYPEGPHFSPFFFNTVLGTVGSVFSLLGIVVYQRYMSTWRFRSIFIVTSLVISAFSFMDVLMFARVNIKLGIPDDLLVMGLSVFESMLAQWKWMPQVVILANLCPKGMEATMYALLAGNHNLGLTIASQAGALLLDRIGCNPKGEVGESAAFDRLWVVAMVATLLPLAAALLLCPLVPEGCQTERIAGGGDATAGSLWRRWFGAPAK